jgi:hypothetical protein
VDAAEEEETQPKGWKPKKTYEKVAQESSSVTKTRFLSSEATIPTTRKSNPITARTVAAGLWPSALPAEAAPVQPALVGVVASQMERRLKGHNLDSVKAKIRPPDGLPYSDIIEQHRTKNHFGQLKQDKIMDEWLRHMQGGFVIEAGAFDGISFSNSLFFELQRNYSCLLVEANPTNFLKVVKLHRKCWTVAGGLAFTDEIGSFEFTADRAGNDVLGGFTEQFTEYDIQRLSAKGIEKYKHDERYSWKSFSKEIANYSKEQVDDLWHKTSKFRKTIMVETFPLNLLLKALGKKTVDIFSLDTEGSEPAILRTLNFQDVEYGLICVEHNSIARNKEEISRVLLQNGFILLRSHSQDDFYGNPEYFKRRGIPLPSAGNGLL